MPEAARVAWEGENPLLVWLANSPRNTVARAARHCGIKKATVYYWLIGHCNPTPENMRRLARLIGLGSVELDDLWLAWWKEGVEHGFIKGTIAAERMLRLLSQKKKKE